MLRKVLFVALAGVVFYVGYGIFNLYTGYKALEKMPAGYVIGPADADVNVVEFLDYACPYCKEVHPTIMAAVRRDGKVRYSPRPVAFLSEESVKAAVLAYAAGRQGRFTDMHDALMGDPRDLNDEVLSDAAGRIGTDLATLEEIAQTQQTQDDVIYNLKTFKRLGGKATPTFIIDELIFYVPEGRMPTVEDFLKMFAEARGQQ